MSTLRPRPQGLHNPIPANLPAPSLRPPGPPFHPVNSQASSQVGAFVFAAPWPAGSSSDHPVLPAPSIESPAPASPPQGGLPWPIHFKTAPRPSPAPSPGLQFSPCHLSPADMTDHVVSLLAGFHLPNLEQSLRETRTLLSCHGYDPSAKDRVSDTAAAEIFLE